MSEVRGERRGSEGSSEEGLREVEWRLSLIINVITNMHALAHTLHLILWYN